MNVDACIRIRNSPTPNLSRFHLVARKVPAYPYMYVHEEHPVLFELKSAACYVM